MLKNIEQLKNPLKYIENYSQDLPISKVVLFFERQKIFFTKTMIQNYIKIELLPAPKGKRYYKKEHLAMLVLIYKLKNVYSLEEIKIIFRPLLEYFEKEEFFKIYEILIKEYEDEYNNKLMEFSNIKNLEEAEESLEISKLLIKSIVVKDIYQKIINNEGDIK